MNNELGLDGAVSEGCFFGFTHCGNALNAVEDLRPLYRSEIVPVVIEPWYPSLGILGRRARAMRRLLPSNLAPDERVAKVNKAAAGNSGIPIGEVVSAQAYWVAGRMRQMLTAETGSPELADSKLAEHPRLNGD